MARHRMTPKRKAALRKAQLISARKRRGKGHHVKKAAVGAAIIGVSAAAIYGGRKAHKSRSIKGQTIEAAPGATKVQKRRAFIALAKRHGVRPEGKTVLLTHRTAHRGNAKKIVESRGWITDLNSTRSGGQGRENHSWFSSEHENMPHHKNSNYGQNRIRVYVPRKKISYRRSSMSGLRGHQWYMVSNETLKNVRHKLVGEKTAPLSRRQQARAKLKTARRKRQHG